MRKTTAINCENRKNVPISAFILLILLIITANINAQSAESNDNCCCCTNDCPQQQGEPLSKEKIPVVKKTSQLKMCVGVNYYALEVTELTHVSINASAEAAVMLFVNDKITETDRVIDYIEFRDGLSWDIPLKTGRYTLGIKSLTERMLCGVSLNIGFYPVSELTEKNPFSTNMTSGQTVMLTFNLDKQSQIGLGLEMSRQTARAALLNENGRIIREGRQLFTKLEKGTYYVKLSIPPILNGTDVKLSLFGQKTITVPPTEELVRWIVRSSPGERPQMSSFTTADLSVNQSPVFGDDDKDSDDVNAKFTILKAGNNERMYTLTPNGVVYEEDRPVMFCKDGFLIVEFSAPVVDPGISVIKNMISFSPAPSAFKYHVEENRIIFNLETEHEKLYRITINPAPITDHRGRILNSRKPCVFYAVNPPIKPGSNWERGFAAVERYGPQYFSAGTAGVSKLDFRVYKIDPFHSVFDNMLNTPVIVFENNDTSGFINESNSQKSACAYSDGVNAYIKTLGDPHYSTSLNINEKEIKKFKSKNIDLKPMFTTVSGKEKSGTYLIGVRRLPDSDEWSYSRVDVTDLSLSTVETKNKVLFAVTNFSTRKTISDAVIRIEGIINNKMTVLAEGKTNTDGIFELEHSVQLSKKFRDAQIRRIVVSKGDDLLLVDVKESNIIQILTNNHWYKGSAQWLRWLSFNPYSQTQDRNIRGFIMTERPVYSTQEKIYIKGIVRETFAGTISLPSSSGSYIFRVHTPTEAVFDYPVILSEDHSFHSEIVSPDTLTGKYKISLLKIVEKQPLQEIAVTNYIVENYTAPNFEVKLTGEQRTLNDRPIEITLNAFYNDGGKLVNENVNWKVTPHSYSYWAPGYRNYLLSTDERYGYAGEKPQHKTVHEISKIRETGNAVITLNPQLAAFHPVKYEIESAVTDTNNQTILSRHTVTALPPFVLGMRTQRHITSGSAISARVVMIDINNDSLLSGQKIDAALKKVSWNLNLTDSYFSFGKPEYITTESVELINQTSIVTEDKPVIVEFKNNKPGVYILELSSTDHLGRIHTVSAYLFVAGIKPQASKKAEEKIFEASADRNSYEPGQQARIILKSTYQRILVLAVAELPDGEILYRWIDIKDGRGVFTFNVTAQMSPKIPVNFLLMRPRVSMPKHGSDGVLTDNGRPQTIFNTTWITVNPVANQLDVKLTHQRAIESNGTLEVTVTLRDSQGKARSGDVTLWMVNEADLSNSRERIWDPLESFLTPHYSHITVRDSRNRSLFSNFFKRDNFVDNPSQSNFAANDAAVSAVMTAPEKTVYWNPSIKIDNSGRTVVRIPIPSDTANYSLRAVAVSGAERFGTAKSRVSVR